MSKPRGKSTTGAGEQRRGGVQLTLAAARNMLPLVSHIVADIQTRWNTLTRLEAEQVDLDRRRRQLGWPERSRRYAIIEELAYEQRQLQEAAFELEQINVQMVDPVQGEVAFPTVMNGRKAYFLWTLGSPDLTGWTYANDSTRHPLPPVARRPERPERPEGKA
jgi:hypothetical protein